MNADKSLTLRVPLSFLGPGKWTFGSFADTPDSAEKPTTGAETTRTMSAAETLD